MFLYIFVSCNTSKASFIKTYKKEDDDKYDLVLNVKVEMREVKHGFQSSMGFSTIFSYRLGAQARQKGSIACSHQSPVSKKGKKFKRPRPQVVAFSLNNAYKINKGTYRTSMFGVNKQCGWTFRVRFQHFSRAMSNSVGRQCIQANTDSRPFGPGSAEKNHYARYKIVSSVHE
jgi:hypothetical protein